MKKARVNKDQCIGCGLCTSLSDLFQIGDDGLAEFTVPEVPADAEGSVEEAKDSCPVQAIEVED